MLKGKKILIGITGGIAAYKIPLLVRMLIRDGAEVKIVMTPCATDFVTPLTLSTLSQKPILIEPYNKVDGSWNSHVEWGRWADVFVIAPASANTLAKMAHGIADNLLTTTYLAAKCPVFFAPAMDLDMLKHPTTKRNIEILCSFGNVHIEAQLGELASGLHGEGRLAEPEDIFETIINFFSKKKINKKILITAGPTIENIDPVRFISNYSSGKMGYAIANEAANRGAEVILISGPVSILPKNSNINLIKVKSAKQMAQSCFKYSKTVDAIIMAAAVSDYYVDNISENKVKKSEQSLTLNLLKNDDILLELGQKKHNSQLLVGFALETNNELENAKAKLKNKNLDFIVLNSLNDDGAGFGVDTNKVTIISKNNKTWNLPLQTKVKLASTILDIIFEIN